MFCNVYMHTIACTIMCIITTHSIKCTSELSSNLLDFQYLEVLCSCNAAFLWNTFSFLTICFPVEICNLLVESANFGEVLFIFPVDILLKGFSKETKSAVSFILHTFFSIFSRKHNLFFKFSYDCQFKFSYDGWTSL